MIDKTMCEVLWRNISDFYVNLRVEVAAVSRNRYGVEQTVDHAESVCFKSVIQSGRSLFLSKIKMHRKNDLWVFPHFNS
jgi:hypothetical protein